MQPLQLSHKGFKAYDIRGQLGDELNEEVALRIARAFAEVLPAGRVVLGRDCSAKPPPVATRLKADLACAGRARTSTV